MLISPLYAAILALLFVTLSLRVALHRVRTRIGFGTGEDPQFERLIRAQANCAEYAPFGILLLALAEAQDLSPLGLHLGGIVLCAGRFAHAAAFSGPNHILWLRKYGMYATFTAITGLALALLWGSLP